MSHTGAEKSSVRKRKFLLHPAACIAIERDWREFALSWKNAAGVAELVDAPDLGSGDESRGGSTPSARTSFRLVRQRLKRLPDNPPVKTRL